MSEVDLTQEHSLEEAYADGYADGRAAANWTPCSVALPPSNGRYPNDVSDDVFVTGLTNENTRYVEQAYYVHKFKTWESCADEGGTLRTVLAWQPLPEPYRGEGE